MLLIFKDTVLAFLKKIIVIDLITAGDAMNRSINKGTKDEKDCLSWINDEYPGVFDQGF